MHLTGSPTAVFDRHSNALLHRRRGALVACALGALLVNAAALLAGDSASSARLTPTTKTTASPNRALLLVPARQTTDAATTWPQATDSASRSAPSVSPAANPQGDAPLAWAKGAEVRAPVEQPIRFYRFTEVDRPADPETDWAIEPEALDKLGLERLAFEVLINDRGEIVGCTILDPPALADDIRGDLEGKLRATPMNPALRGGQRVASARRIEMLLISEGQ